VAPRGGGRAKEPVTWEGVPELDSLEYLAEDTGTGEGDGGVHVEGCGPAAVEGGGRGEGSGAGGGWNGMGDLYTKVHYEGAAPAVGFGSDETGAATQGDICTWLRNQVKDGGVPSPGGVEAMVTYDEEFPYVRTYYAESPRSCRP